MDEELEAGKLEFIKLVQSLNPEAQVVIPTRSSGDHFLISLTAGGSREYISVSEGDILDLPDQEDIRQEVTETVQEALRKIGG